MAGSLWNRLGCCLTGHDYSVVRHDTGRIYLKCDACGHRSGGWSLTAERRQPPFGPERLTPARAKSDTRPKRIAV